MSDLISRQDAIDAIRASTLKYTGFMEMEMYTDDDAVEAINGVPSAQPERRVEKWITKHPYRDDLGKGPQLDLRFHFPSCSNCGAVFGYTPYYCPNCGSKMKNGTEWLDWDTGYGVQEGEEDER